MSIKREPLVTRNGNRKNLAFHDELAQKRPDR
jgi:hypothetical protein